VSVEGVALASLDGTLSEPPAPIKRTAKKYVTPFSSPVTW
jgi:hypothetical protein